MRLASTRITAAAAAASLSLLVAASPTCTSAFTASSAVPSRIRRGNTVNLSKNADAADDDGGDNGHAMQPFFEETALEGAAAVKAMSIEERTRRAMLAEAVEDRICNHYDDLEEILGQEGILPESEEEREEITNIAKQIKVLQNDYKQLVSGERSAYLDGFDFDDKK
mmetsp:Transcript_8159/g.16606  ORF Transcript_8159/g.16606 Transcript_8159/m.16606 type:complete len:167 (-) Transcript_8159:727-1227(-)